MLKAIANTFDYIVHYRATQGIARVVVRWNPVVCRQSKERYRFDPLVCLRVLRCYSKIACVIFAKCLLLITYHVVYWNSFAFRYTQPMAGQTTFLTNIRNVYYILTAEKTSSTSRRSIENVDVFSGVTSNVATRIVHVMCENLQNS